jgi:hypothetical protein
MCSVNDDGFYAACRARVVNGRRREIESHARRELVLTKILNMKLKYLINIVLYGAYAVPQAARK